MVLTSIHSANHRSILSFATSVDDPAIPAKGWGTVRANCPIALFLIEQWPPLGGDYGDQDDQDEVVAVGDQRRRRQSRRQPQKLQHKQSQQKQPQKQKKKERRQRPKQGLRVTYLVQSDPGGSLPERALTMLAHLVPLCVASVMEYVLQFGSPPKIVRCALQMHGGSHDGGGGGGGVVVDKKPPGTASSWRRRSGLSPTTPSTVSTTSAFPSNATAHSSYYYHSQQPSSASQQSSSSSALINLQFNHASQSLSLEYRVRVIAASSSSSSPSSSSPSSSSPSPSHSPLMETRIRMDTRRWLSKKRGPFVLAVETVPATLPNLTVEWQKQEEEEKRDAVKEEEVGEDFLVLRHSTASLVDGSKVSFVITKKRLLEPTTLTIAPPNHHRHDHILVTVNGEVACSDTGVEKEEEVHGEVEMVAVAVGMGEPEPVEPVAPTTHAILSSPERQVWPLCSTIPSGEYYTDSMEDATQYMDQLRQSPPSAWTKLNSASSRLDVSQKLIAGHPLGVLRGIVHLSTSPTPSTKQQLPLPSPMDLLSIVESGGARKVWDKMFHDAAIIDWRQPLLQQPSHTNALANVRFAYTQMIGKWPTSPRDLFVTVTTQRPSTSHVRVVARSIDADMDVDDQQSSSSSLLAQRTAHLPYLAPAYHARRADPKYVRALLTLSGWDLEELGPCQGGGGGSDGIRITYYAQSNPNGWIPNSVLSIVKAQMPQCALGVVEYWEQFGAPPYLITVLSGGDTVSSSTTGTGTVTHTRPPPVSLRISQMQFDHDTGNLDLAYEWLGKEEFPATHHVTLLLRLDQRRWAYRRAVHIDVLDGDSKRPLDASQSSLREEPQGRGVVVHVRHALVPGEKIQLRVRRSPKEVDTFQVMIHGQQVLPECPVQNQVAVARTSTTPQQKTSITSSDVRRSPSKSIKSIVSMDPVQAPNLQQVDIFQHAISPHNVSIHAAFRQLLELTTSTHWQPVYNYPKAFSAGYRYAPTRRGSFESTVEQFPVIKAERIIHAFSPEEVFAVAVGCLGCREQWDTNGFRKGTLVEDIGKGVGIFFGEWRGIVWPMQAREMLWAGMTKRMRSTFRIVDVNQVGKNGELEDPKEAKQQLAVTHQIGTKIYSVMTSVEDDLFPPSPSTVRMSWLLCGWILEPVYYHDKVANSVYSSSLHIPGTKITVIGQVNLKGTVPAGFNNMFANNEVPRMLDNIAAYLHKFGPPPSVRIPIEISAPVDSSHVDWELEERSHVVEITSTDYGHESREYRLRFRILRAPNLFLTPILLDDDPAANGVADNVKKSSEATATSAVAAVAAENAAMVNSSTGFHLLDIGVDLQRLSSGYEVGVDSPNCTLISALLDIRVNRAASISAIPKREAHHHHHHHHHHQFTHNRRIRHHVGVYMRPAILDALGDGFDQESLYPVEVELTISPKVEEPLRPRSFSSSLLLPFLMGSASTSELDKHGGNGSGGNGGDSTTSPTESLQVLPMDQIHDVPVKLNGQMIRIRSTGHIRYLRRTYQSGSQQDVSQPQSHSPLFGSKRVGLSVWAVCGWWCFIFAHHL